MPISIGSMRLRWSESLRSGKRTPARPSGSPVRPGLLKAPFGFAGS